MTCPEIRHTLIYLCGVATRNPHPVDNRFLSEISSAVTLRGYRVPGHKRSVTAVRDIEPCPEPRGPKRPNKRPPTTFMDSAR